MLFRCWISMVSFMVITGRILQEKTWIGSGTQAKKIPFALRSQALKTSSTKSVNSVKSDSSWTCTGTVKNLTVSFMEILVHKTLKSSEYSHLSALRSVLQFSFMTVLSPLKSIKEKLPESIWAFCIGFCMSTLLKSLSMLISRYLICLFSGWKKGRIHNKGVQRLGRQLDVRTGHSVGAWS